MILRYALQYKLSPMAIVGVQFIFMGSLFLLLGVLLRDIGFVPYGGGILFVGLLLFVLARNHPSADLVHRYYQALAKQEYETAFQYLSPAMRMTQASFIQKEQAADAAQGIVTGHLITNFAMASVGRSLSVAHASFTVKVKRDGQWDRVYPYVVKEGRQWKICRFDPVQTVLNNDH